MNFDFIAIPFEQLAFQQLVAITVVVGLFMFFWGLVQFIWARGNDTIQLKGKKHMTWGFFAVFIATAVWYLCVFLIRNF